MRNKVTANSNIWFNGKPATEYGVRQIEAYPEYNRPERKADIFEVPGRSGNVVFLQDAWNEIEKEYEIYTGDGSRGSVPKEFCNISEWLNSADGYARLEDTYEPDIFRLAYCLGAYETENALNRHGRATLTFNCRPERFLKVGEQKVTMEPGGTLRNPTGYNAKPLIYIKSAVGASDIHLVIRSGGKSYHIFFDTVPTVGVYIDCENQNCYDANGINRNNYISCDEFPIFAPGVSEYMDNGQMETSITVIPRWFVI